MWTPFFLRSLMSTTAASNVYFTITAYAPGNPQLDGKIINARGRNFVIGAEVPSTYCALDDPRQCPAGDVTLVNEDMSLLASEVPGGQFIFVSPDGSISYPSAHSALRPPGSQVDGFYASQILSDRGPSTTILLWQSVNGPAGLWACPVSPNIPIYNQAFLRAATRTFTGVGCVSVAGIRIRPAGDAFGAWEYT